MTGLNKKESKRNGLVTTILIHLCILALCFFFGFTYEVPRYSSTTLGFEALGEVNGGVSEDAATSETVSDSPKDQAPSEASSSNVDNAATQEESDVTVNNSDAPSKTPSDVSSHTTKPPVEVVKPKEVDEELKKLGSLLQGNPNPGGTGVGGDPVNGGTATGTPGGTTSGGGGDGVFDLGTRKAINPGNLTHECGKRGSVKVWLKVNSRGVVVEAKVVGGGTSSDPCLKRKAISSAKETTYTRGTDGQKFHEGTITLNFKVN